MDDLDVAHRLADIADAITRVAYRPGQHLRHGVKADGSPVTDHDRHVEERLLAEMARLRPGDGFVGEEVGAHGQSSRRWVVDGIDGTVSFVTGDPRWATQIALMQGADPVVGLSTSPAQRRRWWASSTTPAFTAHVDHDGSDAPEVLLVSAVDDLADATVTCIPPRHRLDAQQAALVDDVLGPAARYVEPTTHGAKMVAAGQADACLQIRGQLWDYAALTVIVEQAGGAVTSLQGPRRLDAGGPLLFTNGRVRGSAAPTTGRL